MTSKIRLGFTLACSAALAAGLAPAAYAHDTETAHATRGSCERTLADINNEDRKHAVADPANEGLKPAR